MIFSRSPAGLSLRRSPRSNRDALAMIPERVLALDRSRITGIRQAGLVPPMA